MFNTVLFALFDTIQFLISFSALSAAVFSDHFILAVVICSSFLEHVIYLSGVSMILDGKRVVID